MIADNITRTTLLEDIEHWTSQHPDKPWLIEHWSSQHRSISWAEGGTTVKSAAAWIVQRLGQPGKKIALLSNNNAHWILADIATQTSGNVTVPLFTSMDADTVKYIAELAEPDLLFLGPASNWEQISKQFTNNIPIVLLPGAPNVEGAIAWEVIVAAGKDLPAAKTVDADALATIVFTSGTTGKPKGVMHSMSTLRAAGQAVGSASSTRQNFRFFSYLPLAHLGERVVVEMHSLAFAGAVYFNEAPDSFLQDLRYAKPQTFMGVPRIWEKLQQAVYAQVLSAQDIEEAKTPEQKATVSDKVKAFLGFDEMEYILTTSALTPGPLKAWYDDLGVAMHDGYGQSEILPISTTRKGHRKTGSIGQASPGVELKIAENGEIMARAPAGTALGYFKAPEATAETFAVDGWVHTGDRGYIDEDGHLFITGRIKEIFKTAKGKYVAPGPIEGRFLDTPLAEQACLTGLGLAQTVMVVVPSETALTQNTEQLLEELIDHAIRINESCEKHERIGALIVSSTPWTMENSFLTHTLKLKREQIEARFADSIAEAGRGMASGKPLFVIQTA